jgi:hypothetical protein
MLTLKVKSRDVTWGRFKKAVQSFKNMTVDIGLPAQGKFKHNGESKVSSYNELVKTAFYNEFGSVKVNLPERALFRTSFNSMSLKIQRMMNAGARDIVKGIITVEQVLNNIGEEVVQKIRDNIVKGMPPKNAPSTIAKKGFNHPMLWTGQLYDNIQYKLRKRNVSK